MNQNCSKWKGTFFLLFLAAFLMFGKSHQVSAAVKCDVIYADSRGNVSTQTYEDWAKTVNRGERVVLPKVKAQSGYRYYWVLEERGKSRKYVPGSRFRVTKDVTFCLKRYKLYRVSFMTSNGRREYTDKRKNAVKGTYVKLPAVPSGANTRGLGWATSRNSKTYQKPGTKVKVTGNMKFYPVTEKVSGVNLRLNNGKVWKVVSTTDVKKATFPSVNMRNGNMCLGWSRRKGKTSNPEYKAGDPIPTKSGNYYMVVFNKKMDTAPSYIREPEKFDKVYLVGDSRTVAYHEVMKSSIPSNVEIIAAGGQGLDWFKTTGYGQLRRQTSRAYQSDRKVKQAVVINLGVNDLKSYSEYVSYMKKAAKTLKRYNCTMYYMSVNPVNSAMNNYFNNGRGRRTEEMVENFNRAIRRGLCTGSRAPFRYINSCAYLQKCGWISDRHNIGMYDGLHYSNETYLRIYDFCMKTLNR